MWNPHDGTGLATGTAPAPLTGPTVPFQKDSPGTHSWPPRSLTEPITAAELAREVEAAGRILARGGDWSATIAAPLTEREVTAQVEGVCVEPATDEDIAQLLKDLDYAHRAGIEPHHLALTARAFIARVRAEQARAERYAAEREAAHRQVDDATALLREARMERDAAIVRAAGAKAAIARAERAEGEVERMRPVIEAAVDISDAEALGGALYYATLARLRQAVLTYRAAQEVTDG